jgi:hypothetical protein
MKNISVKRVFLIATLLESCNHSVVQSIDSLDLEWDYHLKDVGTATEYHAILLSLCEILVVTGKLRQG